MKNNKIAEALQNIEASEPAKERIFSKVKAYANSAAKPKAQPAIVKWLPLTTAACLLLVATVIIFPFVKSEPEEIPAEPPVTQSQPTEVTITPSVSEPLISSAQPPEVTPAYNFTIHENTFDFDVDLLDVWGDEKNMFVKLALTPKNGLVLDEKWFMSHYPGGIRIQIAAWDGFSAPGSVSLKTDDYVENGVYYIEFFYANAFQYDITGEEFRLNIDSMLYYNTDELTRRVEANSIAGIYSTPYEDDEYIHGGFNATFTADYEPVSYFITEINTDMHYNHKSSTLKSIMISEYSFFLLFDCHEPDPFPASVSNDSISVKLSSGEIREIINYGGSYNIRGIDQYNPPEAPYGGIPYEYASHGIWKYNSPLSAGIIGEDIGLFEIVSFIINGQEFVLGW